MIKLPDDLVRNDIAQWLGDGVFFIRIRDDYRPVRWMGLTDSGRVRSEDLVTGEVRTVPPQRCFAHWPELGSFNADRYAVHIKQLSVKQYRRTFNKRCISATLPWDWQVTSNLGTTQGTLLTWDTISRLPFTSRYPADLVEAEQWLADGYLSVAVNRRLIVAGLPDLDKRLFYLDGLLAGSLSGGVVYPTGPLHTMALLSKQLGGYYDVVV